MQKNSVFQKYEIWNKSFKIGLVQVQFFFDIVKKRGRRKLRPGARAGGLMGKASQTIKTAPAFFGAEKCAKPIGWAILALVQF